MAFVPLPAFGKQSHCHPVPAEAAASSTPIFASPSTEKPSQGSSEMSTSSPNAFERFMLICSAPCLNKSQK